VPSSPPSKPQLALYAALAIAVLLIGARFLRSGDAGSGASPGALPGLTSDATTGGGSSAPDGLASSPGGSGSGGAGSGGAGSSGTDAANAGLGGTGGGARVVVDVKGAVRRPGVYRLAPGARVYDAVRRAGGLTRRADRIGVNLAARLADGGEVVVPERAAGGSGLAAAPAGGAGSGSGSAGADQPDAPLSIDLNSATAQELEQLDGVGPAIAANIVAYREQHGPFASIDQLQDVSGIGDAKLAAIRAQLGQ